LLIYLHALSASSVSFAVFFLIEYFKPANLDQVGDPWLQVASLETESQLRENFCHHGLIGAESELFHVFEDDEIEVHASISGYCLHDLFGLD